MRSSRSHCAQNPSAVTVPAIALVVDVLLLRREFRSSLRSLAPWFVLAVAFALIGKLAQPADGLTHAAWWIRPFIVGDALTFYLRTLVLPDNLGIDYGRHPGGG